MTNPLLMLEIEDILEIQANALQAIKDNAQVTSWSSEGTSATIQQVKNPFEMLRYCADALKIKDPATYGRIVKRVGIICR